MAVGENEWFNFIWNSHVAGFTMTWATVEPAGHWLHQDICNSSWSQDTCGTAVIGLLTHLSLDLLCLDEGVHGEGPQTPTDLQSDHSTV